MKKKYILVVDDSEFMRALLQQLLAERYQVSCVADGKSALQWLEYHSVDLILLDVIMPGLSGYEVCRQLKEWEKTKSVPVIFLTSQTAAADEAHGLAVGAVDYLTKPPNPPVLWARVQTHLRLAQQQAQQAFLNQLLQQILALPNGNLAQFLPQVLKSVGEFFSAEAACFSLRINKQTAHQPIFFWSSSQEPCVDELCAEEAIAFFKQAGQQRHCLILQVDDAVLQSQYKDFTEKIKSFGILSLMISPLCDADMTFGILSLRTKLTSIQWDAEDAQFLSLVADVLAGAWQRYAIEQALKTSEARYRSLFQSLPLGAIVYGSNGEVTTFNKQAFDMLGVDPRNIYQYLDKNNKAILQENGLPFPKHQHPLQMVLRTSQSARDVAMSWPHPSQGVRWLNVNSDPLLNFSQELEGAICIFSDITAKKISENELRLAASVFSHAHESILIADADAKIIRVNRALEESSGYTAEELIGKNPSVLKSSYQSSAFYQQMWKKLDRDGYWSGEIWNRKKSGELYAVLVSISKVFDEQQRLQHYVALYADITSQKEYQQKLERIAHYDTLTNLPNRLLFQDRLRQSIAQAKRLGQMLAVLYLDLDGFKPVNDLYGHAVGDFLLQVLAQKMQKAIRETDTLARLGGDEFVFILNNLDKKEALEIVIQRIFQAVSEPVPYQEVWLQVSCSIGITFYPQEWTQEPGELIRQADMAMYAAKKAGKHQYRLFSPDDDLSLDLMLQGDRNAEKK
jgi:diguanylate cyclase (GGDEF)-like protein/PAS domain S-box-containing protein